jgi:hypothetical protein
MKRTFKLIGRHHEWGSFKKKIQKQVNRRTRRAAKRRVER